MLLSFFPVHTPLLYTLLHPQFLLPPLNDDPTLHEALHPPAGRTPPTHLAGWEPSDMALLMLNCPLNPLLCPLRRADSCQSGQGGSLPLPSVTFLFVWDLRSRGGILGVSSRPRFHRSLWTGMAGHRGTSMAHGRGRKSKRLLALATP